MKKSLSHTRVSVKLRKAEFRKEWYLYIESYPNSSLKFEIKAKQFYAASQRVL